MKEKVKNSAKATQGDSWVDVHDDVLMIKLGIRPRHVSPKDPSVWTKSKQEKKILKTLRCVHKGELHFGSIPIREIPVRAKLIIQLKKNKYFPHTTYSTICNMHKIGEILSYYNWDSKNQVPLDIVAKYSFNGKTYKPNERPFWK